MSLLTIDTSLDMTKQLEIAVPYMCILGVILVFSRVYVFAIFVKINGLFTELKFKKFREISAFLMYIFIHKL